MKIGQNWFMAYQLTEIDFDMEDRRRGVKRIRSQYKSRAKRKGIEFDLSFERFGELVLSPCAYCGAEPANELKLSKDLVFPYNGIDRRDSSQGYVWGNVVPCCSFCNSIKAAMPFDDWADFLNGVADLYGGKRPYPEINSPQRAGKSFYFSRRAS